MTMLKDKGSVNDLGLFNQKKEELLKKIRSINPEILSSIANKEDTDFEPNNPGRPMECSRWGKVEWKKSF